MRSFVDGIEGREFEKIDLGSARAVLMALESGDVDVGVIGRTAKRAEFTGFERRIGDGYTLVTDRKQMVPNSELPHIPVNTILPEETVRTKFPYLENVTYRKAMGGRLGVGEVWLISWDDWNDSFELLIPVDKHYNKNPDFRVPHLFSRDEGSLDRVLAVIGKE